MMQLCDLSVICHENLAECIGQDSDHTCKMTDWSCEQRLVTAMTGHQNLRSV